MVILKITMIHLPQKNNFIFFEKKCGISKVNASI